MAEATASRFKIIRRVLDHPWVKYALAICMMTKATPRSVTRSMPRRTVSPMSNILASRKIRYYGCRASTVCARLRGRRYHGDGDIIRAAVEGRGASSLKLLVVPALTSLNERGLRELGHSGTIPDLIVVGRPIVQAADPAEMTLRIVADMKHGG